MENVKKYVVPIVVSILVILWFYMSARADYTWAKLIQEKKEQEGWKLIYSYDNLIDPTHPWTIFKQPINRMLFVKPSEINKIGNDNVFIQKLFVDYESFSRTKEEKFLNVIDCKNNRSAFIEAGTKVDSINLANLEWIDNNAYPYLDEI